MSMKEPEHYILAIDQGTSITRAMLFDHSGRKVIESEKTFPQYYPHNGWVEQDANEIWNSVQSVIASALIDAGVHPEFIDGIGISSNVKPRSSGIKRLASPFTTPSAGSQNRRPASLSKWSAMGTKM